MNILNDVKSLNIFLYNSPLHEKIKTTLEESGISLQPIKILPTQPFDCSIDKDDIIVFDRFLPPPFRHISFIVKLKKLTIDILSKHKNRDTLTILYPNNIAFEYQALINSFSSKKKTTLIMYEDGIGSYVPRQCHMLSLSKFSKLSTWIKKTAFPIYINNTHYFRWGIANYYIGTNEKCFPDEIGKDHKKLIILPFKKEETITLHPLHPKERLIILLDPLIEDKIITEDNYLKALDAFLNSNKSTYNTHKIHIKSHPRLSQHNLTKLEYIINSHFPKTTNITQTKDILDSIDYFHKSGDDLTIVTIISSVILYCKLHYPSISIKTLDINTTSKYLNCYKTFLDSLE